VGRQEKKREKSSSFKRNRVGRGGHPEGDRTSLRTFEKKSCKLGHIRTRKSFRISAETGKRSVRKRFPKCGYGRGGN